MNHHIARSRIVNYKQMQINVIEILKIYIYTTELSENAVLKLLFHLDWETPL